MMKAWYIFQSNCDFHITEKKINKRNLGHKSTCSCRNSQNQNPTLSDQCSVCVCACARSFPFSGEIASSEPESSEFPAACWVNAVITFVDSTAARVHNVKTAVMTTKLYVCVWVTSIITVRKMLQGSFNSSMRPQALRNRFNKPLPWDKRAQTHLTCNSVVMLKPWKYMWNTILSEAHCTEFRGGT